jgi:peptidoglycan/xylan/chitin deacetylase (PgdA/CDA1 family)
VSVVSSVDVGTRKLTALTFDDGPSPNTERILDLLGPRGARATFFVCGHSISDHAETLLRTVRKGHEVGNHTWSHRRPDDLSDDDLQREIAATSDEIERVAGVRPVLMRPPYGRDAERVARIAAPLGLAPTVLWTVDPEDWAETPAEEIVRIVVSEIHPGAIVDLHDGRRGRAPTIEAVAQVLGDLPDYRFVTVSELLATGR